VFMTADPRHQPASEPAQDLTWLTLAFRRRIYAVLLPPPKESNLHVLRGRGPTLQFLCTLLYALMRCGTDSRVLCPHPSECVLRARVAH